MQAPAQLQRSAVKPPLQGSRSHHRSCSGQQPPLQAPQPSARCCSGHNHHCRHRSRSRCCSSHNHHCRHLQQPQPTAAGGSQPPLQAPQPRATAASRRSAAAAVTTSTAGTAHLRQLQQRSQPPLQAPQPHAAAAAVSGSQPPLQAPQPQPLLQLRPPAMQQSQNHHCSTAATQPQLQATAALSLQQLPATTTAAGAQQPPLQAPQPQPQLQRSQPPLQAPQPQPLLLQAPHSLSGHNHHCRHRSRLSGQLQRSQPTTAGTRLSRRSLITHTAAAHNHHHCRHRSLSRSCSGHNHPLQAPQPQPHCWAAVTTVTNCRHRSLSRSCCSGHNHHCRHRSLDLQPLLLQSTTTTAGNRTTHCSHTAGTAASAACCSSQLRSQPPLQAPQPQPQLRPVTTTHCRHRSTLEPHCMQSQAPHEQHFRSLQLQQAVAELANKLLLPKVVHHVHRRLLAAAQPAGVVADMLWAHQQGFQELLGGLKDWYLRHQAEVLAAAEDSVRQLSVAAPSLMYDLHCATVRQADRRQ
ncbi:hypothetical protein PLESTM_000493900 [Pleodorina starrii]|nr:hypothetical protein PLESTM_000493900 [Pleodorina starrii]